MPNCDRCGVEAVPGANFCTSCGAQLGLRCGSCEASNTPDSRFCSNCGSDLALTGGGTGVDAGSPVSPPPPRGDVCPRCYEGNEPGSTYCFSCGLPMDRAEGPSARTYNRIGAFSHGAPGGFWVRLLAATVDVAVVTGMLALILQFALEESIIDYWNETEPSGAGLLDFLFTLLYFTIPVVIWSTTAGKRLLGLYVVRTDGSKLGIGRAIVRFLSYYLSLFLLGMGFVMIAFRQDKRGLHDLLCDTVVIRR